MLLISGVYNILGYAVYDPTFNIGGLCKDKLVNMATYGPKNWLMVMAERDKMRNQIRQRY